MLDMFCYCSSSSFSGVVVFPFLRGSCNPYCTQTVLSPPFARRRSRTTRLDKGIGWVLPSLRDFSDWISIADMRRFLSLTWLSDLPLSVIQSIVKKANRSCRFSPFLTTANQQASPCPFPALLRIYVITLREGINYRNWMHGLYGLL